MLCKIFLFLILIYPKFFSAIINKVEMFAPSIINNELHHKPLSRDYACMISPKEDETNRRLF